MTRIVHLTRGRIALVSDGDYALISQWKWTVDVNGYVVRHPRSGRSRTTVFMHRVILDAQRGTMVDHVNHNKQDNRRENLRLCTNAENLMNMRKRPTNKSGFKGVSWFKGKSRWVASISIKNKRKHLGLFDEASDAARAYDKAAKEIFGEFALTNFP